MGKKRQKKNFFTRVLDDDSTPYVAVVAILFIYFLISLQYIGPAYLSDEIGYLLKAALLSGHSISIPSSWHAGYSILISPAIFLFSNPSVAWRGVQFTNTLMWAGSFVLIIKILGNLFPHSSSRTRLKATLFTLLYPMIFVMTGYSFSTPAVALVFMCAIYSLQRSDFKLNLQMYAFAVFAGLSYWVHPMGLVVASGAVLLFFILTLRDRKLVRYFGPTMVVFVLVLLYQLVIHTAITSAMNVGVISPEHYRPLSAYFSKFDEIGFLWRWVLTMFGQTSYLLIASFGLAGYSLQILASTPRKKDVSYRRYLSDLLYNPRIMLVSVIAICAIGFVVLGSLSLVSSGSRGRLDFWIYGRYAEVALLPLMAIGLMSEWKWRTSIAMSTFVLATGILLRFLVTPNNTFTTNNNKVNIQGFWPIAISDGVHFLRWFALGALTILLVAVLQKYSKRWLVVVVLPLYLLSSLVQHNWHYGILKSYSRPTRLQDVVDDSYHRDTCVGYSSLPKSQDSAGKNERLKMYAYYFYNFDYKEMKYESWEKSCNGPLLTYEPPISKSAVVVGRETQSGLYLVVKREDLPKLKRPEETYKFYFNKSSPACVVQGCFKIGAIDLANYTQGGILKTGALHTTGANGFLFYGQYFTLNPGSHSIKLRTESGADTEGARLEVVATINGAQQKILYHARPNDTSKIYSFETKKPYDKVEVRLFVTSQSDIAVKSYELLIDKEK